MFNRYQNNQNILNIDETYKEIFDSKNVKNILQKRTFDFKKIYKIVSNSKYNKTLYKWENIDRLDLVSQKFYERPDYGWLILYLNNLSNPFQIKTGNYIFIYSPIQEILKEFNNG